jgi:hypothetical protein
VIFLRDPATGKARGSIRGESDELRCLAYAPVGQGLAAAGRLERIRIWDPVTGREQFSLWSAIRRRSTAWPSRRTG